MKRIWAILAIIVCLRPFPAEADMEVHFLDVGQGDCAIVVADGEAMIIDGGTSYNSRKVYRYIRDTLGLKEVRIMVATHQHEDHTGGLSGAMNAAPVGVLLTPVMAWADAENLNSLVRYAGRQGTVCTVPKAGEQYALGRATVTILMCWTEAWNENDMSIVLRVDYGKRSFLFTGDAEYTLEYMLVDSGQDLKADVLKVGHHGSNTSSTLEFLWAVQPEWAVISCGAINDYLHPRQETLDRLVAGKISLCRTDLQGNIIFHTDGTNMEVKTQKEALSAELFRAPELIRLTASLPESTLVGSMKSMKYHTPDCVYGQNISERNLVVFANAAEAQEAGYAACRVCRP